MNINDQNKAIRELIITKDKNKESYTKEDLLLLSQYEGKGGMGSKGEKGEGLLYEFYTPEYIVEQMWALANFHGFTKGNVLEPSFATGRFFKYAPKDCPITGFEIDPISFRIAQLLYPKAQLYNQYFETAFLNAPRFTSRIAAKEFTWLNDYPFSLVIGNPPYGKHKNLYSSYFPNPKMAQLELFFIYYGLKLLKPGGLPVSYTHLRAHETVLDLVCRLLLEKKKKSNY